MTDALIEISNLSKRFREDHDMAARLAARMGMGHEPATVHAVDNVSFSVAPGEVVGLVGESGPANPPLAG